MDSSKKRKKISLGETTDSPGGKKKIYLSQLKTTSDDSGFITLGRLLQAVQMYDAETKESFSLMVFNKAFDKKLQDLGEHPDPGQSIRTVDVMKGDNLLKIRVGSS